jgi:hypothetical protein
VEKDLFIKVLQNYVSTTTDEAQQLHLLKEEFPYSQLLHVLSAKASQAHGLSHQQNELQLAAVYSADRSILKGIMSGQSESNGAIATAVVAPQVEQLATPQAALELVQQQPDLAETIIKDLKELYESRHNFEVMFADGVINPDPEKDLGKSKKERIIELSKALNAPKETESEEKPAMKKRREPRKDIIDELVTSKTKIEPESEKQKEQIEIIDHFIKAQPSISNAKDKAVNITEKDLDTIKTGEFNDNIVSETLVELLLKQGKRDKAVEVLKKLIWKFPQKKAYFAAQIEELKK